MTDLTFDDFRLDTVNMRLWRGDQLVELGGIPLTVLCHLVKHGMESAEELQRPLTKDEIRTLVWGDVHVSDETIRGCISVIRRALSDDPQQPRYILTHNKLGWRFIAKASRLAEPRIRAVQPPHGPYDPAWYIEHPKIESDILGCLKFPGRPVIIYGPQDSGKSTLVSRVIECAGAQQPPDSWRLLRISIRSILEEHSDSLDSMLRELGRLMLDPHEESPEHTHDLLAKAWAPGLTAQVKLKKLLKAHMLGEKTIYLVLSDIERLVPWRFQDAFFDMLRSWQGAEAFSSLRLILESAIPPRLFPLGGNSPLWTKARRIELKGLTSEEIAKLAHLYGLRPSLAACMELGGLVGGLAGLCRQAIYHAAINGITLEAVLKEYQPEAGRFGVYCEHLDDVKQWMELRPQVAAAELLPRDLSTEIELSPEQAWPLVRKGLIAETNERGVYILRCKLYADFMAEQAA